MTLPKLQNQELSFEFDSSKTTVSYKGTPLDNVISVWYQKPKDIVSVQTIVTSQFQEYSLSAIKKHTHMLRGAFADALWVSDYYAIMRAEHKAFQLEAAAKLGMNVPHTLLTSDHKKAHTFIRTHTPVIIKSQAIDFPIIGDTAHFFFTKRITPGNTVNVDNLHLAPAIFQQAIDAVADIRVTVMGNKVFAAAIQTRLEEDGVRDWRCDHSLRGGTFYPYDKDFPKHIAQQCKQLVIGMGLLYGAIDLVLDKKGTFWFLEINPNGQWAFVEEDTGQPMGECMARLLDRR